MSNRYLGLATLAIIHFCVVLTARAETNAVIPYKVMSDLCQIASSADQTKLLIEVIVSSTNQSVRAEDILLTIQSGSQGRISVPVGTNGQILNFPQRKELVRENPAISANQPKGTLRLMARYQIPLRDELTFRYARLGDAAAEATRMIKAQAGMMSLLAPKSQGAVFVFPKESAGKATVMILAKAGRKEFVADDKGLVKLKLEKSLLAENPEVQLSEKPQVALPDIE